MFRMSAVGRPAALALIPICCGAEAQSTVQIGGQIKLGLDQSTISAARPGQASRSADRLTNNTSYWYVDGKEELSATAKAYFHLEWDFAADTGAPGPGRIFFVGLGDNRLGRLLLGRQSVYFSHHWYVADTHGAFDAAPTAANSLNLLGTINGAYFAGGFLNNTVRYELPVIAGFSGMVSYSFDAEAPDQGRNHTAYLNPTYAIGNFKAGLFHMRRNSQGSLPGQTVGTLDQRADKLALGYKWNDFNFGLVFDRNQVTDRATGMTQRRNAFAIPMTYSVGAGVISLTYGQAKSAELNGVTVEDTGAKMLALSYMHYRSRRTSLDLTWTGIRNQSNGRYNFWLGGMGGSQLAEAETGARPRMLYVGMKHVF